MSDIIFKVESLSATAVYEEPDGTTPADEEWIWVSGYKATDKNMCCRDYQYELNKQENIPEGEKIEECENGFHLCRDLKDVFNYYEIGNGNRYFAVRALIRKSDFEAYKTKPKFTGDATNMQEALRWIYSNSSRPKDKLVAKSIVFERELTPEEIFEHYKHDNFTPEEMRMALEYRYSYVMDNRKVSDLVELGLSELMAKFIVDDCEYNRAKAVLSQPGLSMDAKILAIFCHRN